MQTQHAINTAYRADVVGGEPMVVVRIFDPARTAYADAYIARHLTQALAEEHAEFLNSDASIETPRYLLRQHFGRFQAMRLEYDKSEDKILSSVAETFDDLETAFRYVYRENISAYLDWGDDDGLQHSA